MDRAPARGGKLARAADDLLTGLVYYYLTSLPVLIGLYFGTAFVRPGGRPTEATDTENLAAACVRFDGRHYRDIVRDGYDYDPEKRSMVAFFPAYPLLVRFVVAATGLDVDTSLLLVSNTFLALAFGALTACARSRAGDGPAQTGWCLVAFGLWPSMFFFRMAYAESLFVFLTLVVLLGLYRRWPLVVVALIAGLATATRPVGIAVTAAFIWHVVFCRPGRFGTRLAQGVLLIPVACWGLLAYMAYQHVEFGNAFAFAQTQQHWTNRAPVAMPDVAEKLSALATLEPIRGVYDPRSQRFWMRSDADTVALFNVYFWNPTLFLSAAGLVAYGAWRRWLTWPEVVLGAGLLAIPYWTRSYEMSMASHARFAAAVVVIYPVAGRILGSASHPVSCTLAALSAVLATCWTALYTTGHLWF